MAQNFIESRRDQGYLLPPDVREWLPADHLAWFVIGAVEQMDLRAIYGGYRVDGHGAAAYEPSLMVALLLYAYATQQRSSRAIECHCRQDVAYRVITGNVVPDHATIARFVARHEGALAELFGEVLKLCDQAGLVKPGVVAIDGTRLAGSASQSRNRGFERIAREILAEARAIDEAEDEQHGEARGDELPEQLRTAEGRREFFRQAKQRLSDQTAEREELSLSSASVFSKRHGTAYEVGISPASAKSDSARSLRPPAITVTFPRAAGLTTSDDNKPIVRICAASSLIPASGFVFLTFPSQASNLVSGISTVSNLLGSTVTVRLCNFFISLLCSIGKYLTAPPALSRSRIHRRALKRGSAF